MASYLTADKRRERLAAQKTEINKDIFCHVLDRHGFTRAKVARDPRFDMSSSAIDNWLSLGRIPVDKLNLIANIIGADSEEFKKAEPEKTEPETPTSFEDVKKVIFGKPAVESEPNFNVDDIPSIDYRRSTVPNLKNCKKAMIVKNMVMKSSAIKHETDLAKYYGIKKSLIERKFHNDGFSFGDILMAAYACDYTIAFAANDGSDVFKIDPKDYFGADSENWKRISGVKELKVKNGLVYCSEDLPADGRRVVVICRRNNKTDEYAYAHRDKGRWIFDTDIPDDWDNPYAWIRIN